MLLLYHLNSFAFGAVLSYALRVRHGADERSHPQLCENRRKNFISIIKNEYLETQKQFFFETWMYSSNDSAVGQSGDAQRDDVLRGEGDQRQIATEFQCRSGKPGLATSQRPVSSKLDEKENYPIPIPSNILSRFENLIGVTCMWRWVPPRCKGRTEGQPPRPKPIAAPWWRARAAAAVCASTASEWRDSGRRRWRPWSMTRHRRSSPERTAPANRGSRRTASSPAGRATRWTGCWGTSSASRTGPRWPGRCRWRCAIAGAGKRRSKRVSCRRAKLPSPGRRRWRWWPFSAPDDGPAGDWSRRSRYRVRPRPPPWTMSNPSREKSSWPRSTPKSRGRAHPSPNLAAGHPPNSKQKNNIFNHRRPHQLLLLTLSVFFFVKLTCFYFHFFNLSFNIQYPKSNASFKKSFT